MQKPNCEILSNGGCTQAFRKILWNCWVEWLALAKYCPSFAGKTWNSKEILGYPRIVQGPRCMEKPGVKIPGNSWLFQQFLAIPGSIPGPPGQSWIGVMTSVLTPDQLQKIIGAMCPFLFYFLFHTMNCPCFYFWTGGCLHTGHLSYYYLIFWVIFRNISSSSPVFQPPRNSWHFQPSRSLA